MLYTLFYKLLFLSTHTVHHEPFLVSAHKSASLDAGRTALSAVPVRVDLIGPTGGHGFFLLLVAQSLPTTLLFHLGSFLEVRLLAQRVCMFLRLCLPERSCERLTFPAAGVVGRGAAGGRCPGLGPILILFLLLSRAEPMRTTIFQYPIGWPPVQELPPSLRAPPPGGWPLQPSVQWG